MRHLAAAAAVFALAAGSAAAQAPAGQRLSGTIKSASATGVVLAAASGDVSLQITPQTRILLNRNVSASELKVGAYLGTANVTTGEGGRAQEVHIADNGGNVHTVMDANANLMMTNGHVRSVKKTAEGQEIEVDHGAATTRRVVVPASAPITRRVAGDASDLKPGVTVTALHQNGTAQIMVVDPPK
jgi:hypothetical protein